MSLMSCPMLLKNGEYCSIVGNVLCLDGYTVMFDFCLSIFFLVFIFLFFLCILFLGSIYESSVVVEN